jgi:transmembrane sensor
MIGLRVPIAKMLRDDVDRAYAHRNWKGVNARRIRRRRMRERASIAFAFGAGLCAAVIVLFAAGLTTVSRGPVVTEEPLTALASKAPVDWPALAVAETRVRPLEFADGSRLVLDPGGRLSPLENTGRSVAFLLKAGRATFDVVPGGPRRWSIEAGLATVEVIGTRFSVTRSDEQVIVEVERGSVLVRGERVADRVQRLGAGDRLTIDRESRLARATTALSAPQPSAGSVPAPAPRDPSQVSASASGPSIAPIWRELAEEGAYAEAYRNLGAFGVASRAKTADLEQLLALADVARLSGHPREAVEPLRRAVAEHADDPRAAMAAFMLGRLHLDSLQDAASAVSDFRTAIALRLPRALLEDAHLRLIEAAAKSGDRRAAHEAWLLHRQQFPNSVRSSTADRWGREP